MNDIDLPKACLTASSVIVLMVVGVNGHWKLPIAYHFINSLSSMERANIVNDTLIFLHETGVLVTSITFDGPRSHFAMARQLGAKLNVDDDLQVYFLHPISKAKIFVLLDPCHMLKLIRNSFEKLQVIVDGDGNIINWSLLEKLVQFQEQYGLHVATKISRVINEAFDILNSRNKFNHYGKSENANVERIRSKFIKLIYFKNQ
ncbi:THAP domain-containing protein 9 [Trachymyrmex cornetzi]|uniref:THAP domain-containing protein 9 n=1 Tax=Trachymyrmex cornetzi TaxID=471704 RepID=A0A151JRG1_9HYME|nr:THAP domain-containing protein 9 [Trachymyrmex cornetzi]